MRRTIDGGPPGGESGESIQAARRAVPSCGARIESRSRHLPATVYIDARMESSLQVDRRSRQVRGTRTSESSMKPTWLSGLRTRSAELERLWGPRRATGPRHHVTQRWPTITASAANVGRGPCYTRYFRNSANGLSPTTWSRLGRRGPHLASVMTRHRVMSSKRLGPYKAAS